MPDPNKYKDDGLYPKGTVLRTVAVEGSDDVVVWRWKIYLGRNGSWHLSKGRDDKLFCCFADDLRFSKPTHQEALEAALFRTALQYSQSSFYKDGSTADKALREQRLIVRDAVERAGRAAVRVERDKSNSTFKPTSLRYADA